MTVENVSRVWSVAQAVNSERLMLKCAPAIAANFECISSSDFFNKCTTPEGLLALYSGSFFDSVSAGEKLHAAAVWVDNGAPEGKVNDRLDSFGDILSCIRLEELTDEFVCDFFALDYLVNRNNETR